MTKGKSLKTGNYENLFIFAATPSLSGQGGGGLLQPPTPQLFSLQKFLNFFFIDTWVSGQGVGKLTVWQS